MPSVLYIPIKETSRELRTVLKDASAMFQARIKMFLSMKMAGEKGISKRELMDTVGACS